MSNIRTVSILTFVLAAALLWEECCSQIQGQRRRTRNRNNTPRRGDGLPSNLQEAYLSAVDGHNTLNSDDEASDTESLRSEGEWEDLAPSTPASNNVECSVEIYLRRRQGGRCTRLGGTLSRPYICQSGQHFEFNPECERIIEARTSRRSDASQP